MLAVFRVAFQGITRRSLQRQSEETAAWQECYLRNLSWVSCLTVVLFALEPAGLLWLMEIFLRCSCGSSGSISTLGSAKNCFVLDLAVKKELHNRVPHAKDVVSKWSSVNWVQE